ncbi:MAG: hypothetical protein MMC23_008407 [Stictis urceolatum]|nr:hypothetical protein [Stictis urceolata]
MAKDTLEVLDHVAWTSKRELHIVGISMGGMISQELGLLIPGRIASLVLLSTAARIKNTVGYFENLRNRINLLIPKNIDVQLMEVTDRLFGPKFIDQPDAEGSFPTNRDRWGAQELKKRMDTEGFTRKGFLCQIIAAGWHHKSPEQLKLLGDRVGRDRILVVHGTADKMLTVPHGYVLINELAGDGLSSRIFEDSGHIIPFENRKEFKDMMSSFFERTEGMSKQ